MSDAFVQVGKFGDAINAEDSQAVAAPLQPVTFGRACQPLNMKSATAQNHP
jgi:hypothetical protein